MYNKEYANEVQEKVFKTSLHHLFFFLYRQGCSLSSLPLNQVTVSSFFNISLCFFTWKIMKKRGY